MKMGYLATASAAVMILAGAAMAAGKPVYGAWGVDLTARDTTVKPGDDFNRYANGAWDDRTQIPADQGSAGPGYDVYNQSQDQLRAIIEGAAKNPATPTARQIGAIYNSFMDEPRLEQLGAKPMAADLAAIQAAPDRKAFAVLMAKSYGGLGTSIFGAQVFPDAKKSDTNAFYLGQGGLGLPDRDYYLNDGFKPQREAYLAYIERTLALIGYPDPAGAARSVLAFETRIAEVSWAAENRRDIEKLYNPTSIEDLQAYAPEIPWADYLAAAGLPGAKKIVLGEKDAVQKIAKVYGETPLETLKAWQTFQVVSGASPYLSKAFVDNRFQFTSALSGVKSLRPRWKRGVQTVDNLLGEALGQEYVRVYFPAESKRQMEAMVANLKVAMGERIKNLAWMAPETKAQAIEKLDKMRVTVGYPDHFRDYSRLVVDPSDLYGNIQHSIAFEWAFQVGKVGNPVDPGEWDLTPQTVNASNGGLANRIIFPAAILQPPYFDPNADPAVNYGAIGAVIGHEITHGFDDEGRKIDASGNLRDWWAPKDAARFEAEAAKLGKQYDGYEAVPGMHVNGKLTMGENIADLGGILVALDAYHKSLHGKPAPVIDGLTGDQRFFLAYAQAWREKDREDSLKQQMASDPHAPSSFRALGTPRNVDAWYAAFGITGGKYYLKPDERVRIW